ncbi:Non-specific serine/threonine protein kinase [Sphingobium sp. EP60837]|nr:Non-specific serine/threonine protein kinase [Sphingobium sp. EP60837]
MIWGRKAAKTEVRQVAPRSPVVEDGGILLPSGGEPTPKSKAATALLDQLADEGLAERVEDGHRLNWSQLFVLLEDAEAAEELAILDLPSSTAAVPKIVSRKSLTDRDFSVAIDGWFDTDRRPMSGARLKGGALEVDGGVQLVAPGVWNLIERIRRFARRPEGERNEADQRRAWGEIRQLAVAAGASLDDFLYRTVVLTPDRLQMALRRSDGLGLVEIEPWFEGAPADWLEAFDKSGQVRDRYDLPTPHGIIQVMISPEVGTVLREVKRMPGRRVAGERAQAFLLNPIAALGPDAAAVVDEDQFEEAKQQAGIVFEQFAAVTPETNGEGALGLLITSGSGDAIETREIMLEEADVLEFIEGVERNLDRGLQLFAWDEYEFELDGDSRLHCEALRRALGHREDGVITHGQIYDLSGYSERVEGIGQEKSFYSPHIAKRDDGEGWFPENLVPMIGWTDPNTEQPCVLPLTDKLSAELRKGLEMAKAKGATSVSLTGCPTPIPVREAEAIVSTFGQVQDQAAKGTFKPDSPVRRGKKPTLILKSNIGQVDYQEERLAALAEKPAPARLPSSLRPGVALKHHQLEGLAWMQHLLALAPDKCRGALLADDMGLGKTLQILSLVARAREEDPGTPPALVVAPLSLLENWKEEAEKFLESGTLKILMAYGEGLAGLRVDRSSVDEQLRREGLVRFLRPDWRGDADLVLTTYETLRDLEFSFAREKWSVMVCDEAQKIKNPNAAMTRAAKKQQAKFRIACTGTPVENSLVDLWCLFDFVQPGLLGALNEFGSTYRRPIEAKSDDDRVKVEQLRGIITPQLLRRMKADVATDLKAKVVDEESRSLDMSPFQRGLYVGAIDTFRRSGAAPGSHLALLHKLRLLCSDPDENAGSAYDPVESYRARSPKLDWLIEVLEVIRDRGEKAIVFCEFKAIQRLIRHYVREAFDVPVDIINGDTTAVGSSIDSRQKRIRAFQEQPGFGVIVLSPVAVGFGVNMQAANHVIHFTRTWNPAKEDQATDRAYRIGQTKDVFVYYPTVSAGDFKTFDVKLDELLERKRSLASDMLNGSGEIGLRDFDVDELRPVDP